MQAVLITGCSPGGIGHALAREFHARGLRVFATARNLDKISDLQDLGIQCFSLSVDSHSSVTECYKRVEIALGDDDELAYLINNAGTAYYGPATETPIAEARAIFETNLLGAMDMNTTFLPLLRKSKGAIVHIGSVTSFMPIPFNAAYCASKAALYSYCNTLRLELEPFGIRVVCVQAARVKTNMVHSADKPADRESLYVNYLEANAAKRKDDEAKFMPPEELAADVVKQLLAGPSWWRNQWIIWTGGEVMAGRVLKWVADNSPWDVWGFLMRRLFMQDGN